VVPVGHCAGKPAPLGPSLVSTTHSSQDRGTTCTINFAVSFKLTKLGVQRRAQLAAVACTRVAQQRTVQTIPASACHRNTVQPLAGPHNAAVCCAAVCAAHARGRRCFRATPRRCRCASCARMGVTTWRWPWTPPPTARATCGTYSCRGSRCAGQRLPRDAALAQPLWWPRRAATAHPACVHLTRAVPLLRGASERRCCAAPTAARRTWAACATAGASTGRAPGRRAASSTPRTSCSTQTARAQCPSLCRKCACRVPVVCGVPACVPVVCCVHACAGVHSSRKVALDAHAHPTPTRMHTQTHAYHVSRTRTCTMCHVPCVFFFFLFFFFSFTHTHVHRLRTTPRRCCRPTARSRAPACWAAWPTLWTTLTGEVCVCVCAVRCLFATCARVVCL
jgi:hypothetical protein